MSVEPPMHAIKAVRKRIEEDSESESSRILIALVRALGEESEFSLASLYRLDYGSFEAALDLLRDWRLDRYYAARLRLFDAVLQSGARKSEFDDA
jgi:hypothetical protein